MTGYQDNILCYYPFNIQDGSQKEDMISACTSYPGRRDSTRWPKSDAKDGGNSVDEGRRSGGDGGSGLRRRKKQRSRNFVNNVIGGTGCVVHSSSRHRSHLRRGECCLKEAYYRAPSAFHQNCREADLEVPSQQKNSGSCGESDERITLYGGRRM